MQCNSMDKNVDQCSAVECTAAQPRLTKSPKEEEKSLYVFFCVGASISIGREIWCLPYAGFFSLYQLPTLDANPWLSMVISLLRTTFYGLVHRPASACLKVRKLQTCERSEINIRLANYMMPVIAQMWNFFVQ